MVTWPRDEEGPDVADDQEARQPLFYRYILVRRDLPIEKQMIHACHAADESVTKEVAQLPDTTRIVPDGPEYGRGYVSIGVDPTLKRSKMRKLFHHQRWLNL
jgi:hypothetical protein